MSIEVPEYLQTESSDEENGVSALSLCGSTACQAVGTQSCSGSCQSYCEFYCQNCQGVAR